MARNKGSSHRWRARQTRDPYVDRAAREGYRSRAAFKLEEIDKRERLLKRGMTCVDLGAAPGGWSQLAIRRVAPKGRVIAIDLLPMDPIADVEFLEADFMSDEGLASLRNIVEPRAVDLVMSDMAPNISGNRSIDQPRSMALAESAMLFADEVLKVGGNLLLKLFQGEGQKELEDQIRARYERLKLLKPKASRPESREIYLLASRYRMV
ncbi:MAG: RlmE family RNA methyltransferase [Gammaproteobacteria bacterium]|nr:RlmE family RNA methyltransferase [Gammaproteobacteria bacterium]